MSNSFYVAEAHVARLLPQLLEGHWFGPCTCCIALEQDTDTTASPLECVRSVTAPDEVPGTLQGYCHECMKACVKGGNAHLEYKVLWVLEITRKVL